MELPYTITTVQPTARFRVIEIGSEGRVSCFVKKQRMDTWANVGFMVFNPEVLRYVGGHDCAIETATGHRDFLSHRHR